MNGKYLLLGSNLGDRLANISSARTGIAGRIGRIISSSSIYETKAWGYQNQPDFLNQVVGVETGMEPEEILGRINDIENELGRKRYARWRERMIDIDLLYYDDKVINTPDLHIPHPEIPNRRFTLIPLCEIAAEEIHPVLKKTQLELLDETEDDLQVKKIS